MATAKTLTLKRAREAARGGDVDRALPLLLNCAEAGDVTAAASAAELLAYLDRWSEVIPLAGAFAADPFATYAGNVSDDMVRLLGRAAIETGEWARVATLAREARAEVDEALDRNRLGFPQVKVESVRARETKILEHLRAAAERQDAAACAEPIYIFGGVSRVGRREAFEAAIAKPFNRTPEKRLTMAIIYGQDEEALRAYAQLSTPPLFDQALDVAKAMMRVGAAEEAGRAIEVNWANWYPVDVVQVAPVALVTDALLLPLMSATRRNMLIRMPRAGSGRHEV